jgi:RNAse (barnase) inhibitor barstar
MGRMKMRIIDLSATNWKSTLDFYDALLAALGAPRGHGKSVDALIDSMVWGGMNKVEPPYTIRIFDTARLPTDARDHIEALKRALPDACAEFQKQEGRDVVIRLETYA